MKEKSSWTEDIDTKVYKDESLVCLLQPALTSFSSEILLHRLIKAQWTDTVLGLLCIYRGTFLWLAPASLNQVLQPSTVQEADAQEGQLLQPQSLSVLAQLQGYQPLWYVLLSIPPSPSKPAI